MPTSLHVGYIEPKYGHCNTFEPENVNPVNTCDEDFKVEFGLRRGIQSFIWSK